MAKSATVVGFVNEQWVPDIKLDSGAGHNLIAPELVPSDLLLQALADDKKTVALRVRRGRLQAADGSPIPVVAEVTIPVRLGSCAYEVQFYVSPVLKFGVLL